jgi:ABC-type Fe3+-siderophore transport system permease subunit
MDSKRALPCIRSSQGKSKVLENLKNVQVTTVQKAPKRGNRLELLMSGAILGAYLNLVITLQPSMEILYIGVILSVGVVTLVFVLHSWHSEKKLGKTRKFRLFLFGISFVSFLFAAGELIQFLLGPHGTQQALFGFSDSYPYLWIGNIPLISFLASAVSGGFFGLLERFLELHEKKDL